MCEALTDKSRLGTSCFCALPASVPRRLSNRAAPSGKSINAATAIAI
jgi:hypothetical protein